MRIYADAPTPEVAELVAAVAAAASAEPLDLTEVALRARLRDRALRGWIRLAYTDERPWRRTPVDGVRDVWALRDLIRALCSIGDVQRATRAVECGFEHLAAIDDPSDRLSRCCEVAREISSELPDTCLAPFIDMVATATAAPEGHYELPELIIKLIDAERIDAAERCMDAYTRLQSGPWAQTYTQQLAARGHFTLAERAALDRLDGIARTEALADLAHRLADTGDHISALRVAGIAERHLVKDPGNPNAFHSEAIDAGPVTVEIALDLAWTYAKTGDQKSARARLAQATSAVRRSSAAWAGYKAVELVCLADLADEPTTAQRMHKRALQHPEMRTLLELAARDLTINNIPAFTAVESALDALPEPSHPSPPSDISSYIADVRDRDPAHADRLAAIPAVRAALDAESTQLRHGPRPGDACPADGLAQRFTTNTWSDCLTDLATIDPDALQAVADAECATAAGAV